MRLCALLFLFCGCAGAAEFSGKVIAVLDGDTLLLLRGNNPVKVRLADVDAPEKAQSYGIAAQKSLTELAMGKQIRVVSRAVDDYGRLVATVYVNGFDVNREQVRRGLAWEYSRYHSNRELMALQREAQQARRGLWTEDAAVEPSQWRKQHPFTVSVCGKRKHCSEMSSCEEARHYLTACGVKSLDGNGDGVPCENLCAGRK